MAYYFYREGVKQNMKKAFGVVFLLVVIVLGFFGYQYWEQHRTMASESYAKVTQGTKHASKNNDGSPYKS